MGVAGFFGVAGGLVGGIITEGVKTDWEIDKGFWTDGFLKNVLPSAIINGISNVLSLGLSNMITGGIGLFDSTFLSRFASGLKISLSTIVSSLLIGFPMTAIGLIPIAITAAIRKRKGV